MTATGTKAPVEASGFSFEPTTHEGRVKSPQPGTGAALDTAAGSGSPLWTVNDLAAFLGVSRSTVYRLREQGAGPRAVKVGQHLRFRPADVGTWLDTTVADEQPETSHPERPAHSSEGLDDQFWR